MVSIDLLKQWVINKYTPINVTLAIFLSERVDYKFWQRCVDGVRSGREHEYIKIVYLCDWSSQKEDRRFWDELDSTESDEKLTYQKVIQIFERWNVPYEIHTNYEIWYT